MWSSVVRGVTLHFRLTAINNQNFVMEDVETGTWWQQVTGEALQGPLTGERLRGIRFQEIAFGIWGTEYPDTIVMLPEDERTDRYLGADWEQEVQGLPLPAALRPLGDLQGRDIVVGLVVQGRAIAYPLDTIAAQTPIADQVGTTALLVACAADGRSVRVFDRRVNGRVLDLYARPESEPPVFIDVQTGSEWNFAGLATSGPMIGSELEPLAATKDFWFDWHNHHPDTRVYTAGGLPAGRGGPTGPAETEPALGSPPGAR